MGRENKRADVAGRKKRKGLAGEPLPAKPHFTPSRNKPERINHPGKNQNHLISISANEVPHLEYLFITT
jgi:hypothetical protein